MSHSSCIGVARSDRSDGASERCCECCDVARFQSFGLCNLGKRSRSNSTDSARWWWALFGKRPGSNPANSARWRRSFFGEWSRSDSPDTTRRRRALFSKWSRSNSTDTSRWWRTLVGCRLYLQPARLTIVVELSRRLGPLEKLMSTLGPVDYALLIADLSVEVCALVMSPQEESPLPAFHFCAFPVRFHRGRNWPVLHSGRRRIHLEHLPLFLLFIPTLC